MIAIVKYNAGNIGSVTNALNRLGIENKVTDDPEELKAADKVIFPGVGEAGTAMNYLRERGLDQVIKELKQPVLGICLGMQLMCSHSEEGDTECLGIFDTTVKKFPVTEGMKVPHMGWNSLSYELGVQSSESFLTHNSELLTNLQPESDVYYVHSYYAEVCKDTVAACDYILPFSSVLQKDNFYATQFHPEKSAGVGEEILKNFLKIPA
ncbi:glutamine amidotransferase [Nonlabens dokdonensis]|uniref:Imidazole glycerol phosphate synthase subunit HisH n=2 Tax=Nonlabens dokdonensis TaxID=328515 RepID=L7W6D0_NONDD|nr:imidazole glycerol phosphate synthase subunit HisH [Nonlabens dokdonensis]AGC75737.1 imidazole glycerol phosphate synthase, glutamine amidotransferase class-I subunit [Nonlabens dokdonensis DSW-6]PZX43422.1 glutamine amidotransferase [Nonlabens dokdonensis]